VKRRPPEPPPLVLWTYKEQQGVERAFGFIKSDEFHLDNIYQKNPNRIDALIARDTHGHAAWAQERCGPVACSIDDVKA
jgi:hypothetical protein